MSLPKARYVCVYLLYCWFLSILKEVGHEVLSQLFAASALAGSRQ